MWKSLRGILVNIVPRRFQGQKPSGHAAPRVFGLGTPKGQYSSGYPLGFSTCCIIAYKPICHSSTFKHSYSFPSKSMNHVPEVRTLRFYKWPHITFILMELLKIPKFTHLRKISKIYTLQKIFRELLILTRKSNCVVTNPCRANSVAFQDTFILCSYYFKTNLVI